MKRYTFDRDGYIHADPDGDWVMWKDVPLALRIGGAAKPVAKRRNPRKAGPGAKRRGAPQ